MALIEIIGRVNDNGQVEAEVPADFPRGEARITVEIVDTEAEAASEAKWDALFEKSQDLLEQMAQEAHEEYLAGLTEDF